MKRTYWRLEKTEHGYEAECKITCEVTGEMDDGAKVWTDVDTGEQYFCTRILGTYYFYKE